MPATSFQHMFPDGTNRFYNPVPITPGETLTDPVGKMRVSTPQALIDTDFEYSTQSTKWESLSLLNNRGSAFYDVTAPLNVSAVSASTTTITVTTNSVFTGTYAQTGTTTIIVTIAAGHNLQVGQRIWVDYTSGTAADEAVVITATTNTTFTYISAGSLTTSGNAVVYLSPAVGTPIFVQGTTQTVANGWFVVATSPGITFTYVVASTAGSGTIFDATKTYIYTGNFYTGSGIPLTGTTAFTFSTTTITCTTTNAHGLTVGDGIFVVGTTASTNAPNGSFVVRTIPSVNTFTYSVAAAPTGTINNTAGSVNLFPRPFGSVIHRSFDGGVDFTAGYPYTGNQLIRQTRRYFRYQSGKGIQFSTGTCLKPAFNVDSITSSGTTVTVNLKTPHNLNGNYLTSNGIPVSATAGAAFTYVDNVVTCTTTNNHGFSVGDSIFITLTTSSGTNPPNGTWTVLSVISTTQFTFVVTDVPTGTITAVATSSLYAAGTGPFVTVSGCTDSAYNGTFLVRTVPTDLSFTYTALVAPITTPDTGFPITINPQSWWNAKNRIGLFDDQNGFFFESDGQTLYAVKRSSTTQLSGSIAVNAGATTVTGTSTTFSTQLIPGDAVVIRGMLYNVLSIISDTSMVIYPEYRGAANISNTVVSKRIEEHYPQATWNMDRCDGTGPSNFDLDLTKMQMLYIDYAWYGAGAIRFGFKDQNGEIFYCHRIPNSNRNTEAYMRSGNICARYECNTVPAYTKLTATLTSTATNAITVASTEGFPKSGVAVLTKPANVSSGSGANVTGGIEYIQYNNKTATQLLGLRRGITSLTGPGGLASGGGTGTNQTFTFSATAPIQVQAYPGQFASTLAHWGSAVIMDGRYDDDKSFIFQAGMATAASNIGASVSSALLSIRLSPAVDSGITGILGARDLINRMQLTLRQMDIVATGTAAIFRVELILNGRIGGTGAGAFTSAGGSSLTQIALHSTSGATTVTGGESILSFFAYTPGVVQQELNLVRDLGNCILGGGTNNTVPTTTTNLYPDGPDVVTVKITNVSAVTTNTISTRISWTEAQA